MNEVSTIEDYIDLLPKDSIADGKDAAFSWLFDPHPTTSFEIAWEMAH